MTVNTLDSLVREIVKIRDCCCFTCGRTDLILEVGHFVPRRYKATRWDLRNCHLQCINCNRMEGGNLGVYANKLGDVADELWQIARTNQKTDLEAIHSMLVKERRKLYEERGIS